MQTTTPNDPRSPGQRRTDPPALETMRSAEFRPRRSAWPGLLVAGLIAAGIAAVVVTEYGDERSAATPVVAQGSADAAITAAVKTALAADPALSAVKIDVSTRDGAVLLEGPAPDESSRERAAVLAAAPKGVARVDNNLVVTKTPSAPATPAAQ